MIEFHVILDTNVLPQDPEKVSPFLKTLEKLVNLNIAKIYIPYVVVEEWRSQWRAKYKSEIRGITKGIQRTIGPWIEQTPQIESIKSLLLELESLKKEIILPDKIIDSMLLRLKAIIIPVSDQHAKPVIEAYFRGHPPFKNIKNRLDFPDAFIFECIKDVTNDSPGLSHVITNDKGMMNACNQIQELKVYNSIQAFVEDPRVNAITQALEDPNGTWQRILEQANSRLDNLNSSIFKKLEDEEPYLDLILYREVSHRQFPSDDRRGLIVGLLEPYDLDIDWENYKNFAPGMLSVPFSLMMVADIELSIFKSEAFDTPEEIRVRFDEMFNDLAYLSSLATVNIAVSGTLVIEFSWRDYHNTDELLPVKEINVTEIVDINVPDYDHEPVFIAVTRFPIEDYNQ